MKLFRQFVMAVFGASGTNHKTGAVPDPGAVAGTTKFLREDASWGIPPGTGVHSGDAAGGDLGGTYPNPTVSDHLNRHTAINKNSAPATSAALEVAGTDGALLIPRMNSTQRDALTPANGMLIYNTTTTVFEFYENGSWVVFLLVGQSTTPNGNAGGHLKDNYPNPKLNDYIDQHMAINKATAPVTSAALEIAGTDGALLLPRLTTTQRDALTSVNGMLIYNSTTAQFEVYQAGAWLPMGVTMNLTPYHLVSAASNNATSVATGARKLGMVACYNNNASPRYMKIYDKASAPTPVSDTPVLTLEIPGNSTNGAGSNLPLPHPISLSLGLAFAIVSGIADNDNTSIGAGDVVANLGYV